MDNLEKISNDIKFIYIFNIIEVHRKQVAVDYRKLGNIL